MSESIFKLAPAAFITIESDDGSKCVRLDLYKTRRFLQECQQQPTEDARWEKVNKFIAEKLQVDASQLAESVALELQALVNALVEKCNDRLKKSIDSTLSLPLASQESPTTSNTGP